MTAHLAARSLGWGKGLLVLLLVLGLAAAETLEERIAAETVDFFDNLVDHVCEEELGAIARRTYAEFLERRPPFKGAARSKAAAKVAMDVSEEYVDASCEAIRGHLQEWNTLVHHVALSSAEKGINVAVALRQSGRTRHVTKMIVEALRKSVQSVLQDTTAEPSAHASTPSSARGDEGTVSKHQSRGARYALPLPTRRTVMEEFIQPLSKWLMNLPASLEEKQRSGAPPSPGQPADRGTGGNDDGQATRQRGSPTDYMKEYNPIQAQITDKQKETLRRMGYPVDDL